MAYILLVNPQVRVPSIVQSVFFFMFLKTLIAMSVVCVGALPGGDAASQFTQGTAVRTVGDGDGAVGGVGIDSRGPFGQFAIWNGRGYGPQFVLHLRRRQEQRCFNFSLRTPALS